jgi:hypothetical protein
MTPSSTLSRTVGPDGSSVAATAIQQPMCAQTAVATPSTRSVFPTKSAGLETTALIGVASVKVTPAPIFVSAAAGNIAATIDATINALIRLPSDDLIIVAALNPEP